MSIIINLLAKNPLLALALTLTYIGGLWYCAAIMWNTGNHVITIIVFLTITLLTKALAKSTVEKLKLAKEKR